MAEDMFDEMEVELGIKRAKVTVEAGAGIILMAFAGLIVRGMMLEWAWNHFVAYALHVPTISVAIALGIASLAFFVTNDPTSVLETGRKQLARGNFLFGCINEYCYYAMAFVTWWVIWQFV